jgi:hypothetical protein
MIRKRYRGKEGIYFDGSDMEILNKVKSVTI